MIDTAIREVSVPGEVVEGIRVLMVDASASDTEEIRRALDRDLPENQEVSFRSCVTLLDALREIENEQSSFDSILLDLSLPDATGLESLLRIKGVAKNTPILVVTELRDARTLEAAIQLGAHSIIKKDQDWQSINIWECIAESIINGHKSTAHHIPLPSRKCFFHLNEHLRITRWDADCELMTGWQADKVLEKPIEALTVKGFRPDVHAALLQPNAHKGKAIEFDLITPQKTVTRLSLTACESVDHLSRWQFSIPEDEQSSTISSQVVTAIMRKSHDLLFITDYEGRIRRCNKAAMDLLGLPETRIVGEILSDLTTAASRSHSQQALRTLLRGDSFSHDSFEFCNPLTPSIGLRCDVEFTPLRDSYGGLIGGCMLATPVAG